MCVEKQDLLFGSDSASSSNAGSDLASTWSILTDCVMKREIFICAIVIGSDLSSDFTRAIKKERCWMVNAPFVIIFNLVPMSVFCFLFSGIIFDLWLFWDKIFFFVYYLVSIPAGGPWLEGEQWGRGGGGGPEAEGPGCGHRWRHHRYQQVRTK